MNTTISSNGLPQLPLATTSTDSSASQASTTSSASNTASAQTDDSVKLTDSAHALHQASSTGSPVDTAKVEQIKKSLAAGTYKVDPNAIADRLTSMENQIGGTK
ncbi:flagellar biosynthesis anti-sigma factor FlgM [Dyella acidiphila]|uniref:Negative regulator of flagellin synthesis n=1 Tax=Dyella acidiphila TaxID=2775866 RepID=A0ABR9G682_9GAMM|nr:flagellar biosynthesis anti-sigma factor FlgM [Dyella acidiphila]MBE1159551.1 flagellar biosynthesis anti-sigma factor FlgM [Dyella acidiphila]